MTKSSVQYRQPSLFDVVEPDRPNEQVIAKKSDVGAFDLIDTVRAPILSFNQSWADTIPSRMLAIVPFSRMKSLIRAERMASFAECSIYIYSRALEAPMDSDWTEMYLHVSCMVLEEFFQEDRWETLHAPRKLSDWQEAQLTGLRRHIYDKRREELKKRLNQLQKPADKSGLPEPAPESATPQKSLF